MNLERHDLCLLIKTNDLAHVTVENLVPVVVLGNHHAIPFANSFRAEPHFLEPWGLRVKQFSYPKIQVRHTQGATMARAQYLEIGVAIVQLLDRRSQRLEDLILVPDFDNDEVLGPMLELGHITPVDGVGRDHDVAGFVLAKNLLEIDHGEKLRRDQVS